MHDSPHQPDAREPQRPWRVAVIGGGLGGLAAAHRLQKSCEEMGIRLELELFEAAERLGGVIGPSRRNDGPKRDWLVEPAADSFLTSKPWAVELCEELGIADRLIPTEARYRRSLVLRKGKPVPVPAGFMLMAPAKLKPILASPIFSPWGKLRMGLEYFIPRRSGDDDESLASFVRRRFGREALDRLVQPLVGGIYTGDPERLSLRATLPRFLEMERAHRSLIVAARRQSNANTTGSGARYGLFATLAGGMWELVEALERELAGRVALRRDTPVARIARLEARDGEDGPIYEVVLAEGSTAKFDAALVAVPADRAAEMLESMDAELACELRGIEYASTAVVVSGHSLAEIRHPLDAFGLVIPARERRRVLAVSFSSRKFPNRAPEGKVLLRTFVGGAMQPEALEARDDEIIAMVREELHAMLSMAGTPDFEFVHRWAGAMPQYHVGHLDRVARVEQRIAGHPGFALAGNALRGVGIPDVIHSGELAARRLLESRLPQLR